MCLRPVHVIRHIHHRPACGRGGLLSFTEPFTCPFRPPYSLFTARAGFAHRPGHFFCQHAAASTRPGSGQQLAAGQKGRVQGSSYPLAPSKNRRGTAHPSRPCRRRRRPALPPHRSWCQRPRRHRRPGGRCTCSRGGAGRPAKHCTWGSQAEAPGAGWHVRRSRQTKSGL